MTLELMREQWATKSMKELVGKKRRKQKIRWKTRFSHLIFVLIVRLNFYFVIYIVICIFIYLIFIIYWEKKKKKNQKWIFNSTIIFFFFFEFD